MALFSNIDLPFVTSVLTLVPKASQLTHWYSLNPFNIFVLSPTSWESDIINAVKDLCLQEQISHSKRAETTIRQQLAQRLFIPRVGELSLINRDIVTDEFTGVTKTSIRERSYVEFSLCAFIWFTSAFIAIAPNRDKLMQCVYPNQQIPTLLTEFLQKIRFTQVPSLVIRIGFNLTSIIIPTAFRGTYLDPAFLCSESNFSEYLSLLNVIASSDGNYVSFSAVNESNRSVLFPPTNGGHQATFCLINTISDIVNRPYMFIFELRPNSSFSNAISSIHPMDACVLGSALYTDETLSSKIEFIQELDFYNLSFTSTSSVLHYIIQRVITPSKPVYPTGNAGGSKRVKDAPASPTPADLPHLPDRDKTLGDSFLKDEPPKGKKDYPVRESPSHRSDSRQGRNRPTKNNKSIKLPSDNGD
jgi:hypothetical protein